MYQSILLLLGAPVQRLLLERARLTRAAQGSLWSLRCSVPFIAATVSERRRALAAYPVLLLYTTIGVLAVSS